MGLFEGFSKVQGISGRLSLQGFKEESVEIQKISKLYVRILVGLMIFVRVSGREFKSSFRGAKAKFKSSFKTFEAVSRKYHKGGRFSWYQKD